MRSMDDSTGAAHICPRGSSHSVVNAGREDPVLLAILTAGA